MKLSSLTRKMLPSFSALFLLLNASAKSEELPEILKFEVGKTTTLEKRLNVDFVGDFDLESLSKIRNVLDRLENKCPSYKEIINMVIERNDEQRFGMAQNNFHDSRFPHSIDLVYISSRPVIEKYLKNRIISSYEDILAHEIGHILISEYRDTLSNGGPNFSTDSSFLRKLGNISNSKKNSILVKRKISGELRQKFIKINGLLPEVDLSLTDRQIGFVSNYADKFRYTPILNSSQITQSKNNYSTNLYVSFAWALEEDIAETFAYLVGDYRYADCDSLVQEKIKALKEFIQTVYTEK